MIPQNDYNEKDFEILRKKVGVGEDVIKNITDSVTQTVINNIENTIVQNIKNEVIQEVSADFTTAPKIRWATNALFNQSLIGNTSTIYDSVGNSTLINGVDGTSVENLGPITIPHESYASIGLINYAPSYEKNGKAVKFSPVVVRYTVAGIIVQYRGNGWIKVHNLSGKSHDFMLKNCIMEGLIYDFSNSNEIDPESSWTFGGGA